MNRIYKVIWSKVKHQYVVVSELAHSNGKQSRTARKSLRSRIAALVVCGAIAAFGVYGALPVQQAFAAGVQATESQYIAIGDADYTDADNCNNGWFGEPEKYNPNKEYYRTINGHKYVFTHTDDGNFWVRDGYSIEIVHEERFTGAGGPKKDIQINATRGADADTNGLVQSYQNTNKDIGMSTLNGGNLQNTDTDVYGGAVNTPTFTVTSNSNEFIINNGTKAISGTTQVNTKGGEYSYFQPVDEVNGQYYFNKEKINPDDLYVVDGVVGVFTTTAGGSTVYKDSVFGRNNEILMTGVNDNGDLVTYWGAKIEDPNAPIGSMPKYVLQGKFDKAYEAIAEVHKDNIKQIEVDALSNIDDGQGGTIGLRTNGEFKQLFNDDGTPKLDSEGNPMYVAQGGAAIPGGITVTSEHGDDGKDVRVKFKNDNGSFTVDAGSKVEVSEKDDNNKVTELKINGQKYSIGGGSSVTDGYVDGDGNIYINQEGDTPGQGGKLIGKITVSGANGLKVTANRIDGNKGINYEVSNNLTVNSEAGEQHKNGGNWTITDSQGETPLTLTNTTLVAGKATKTPIENNEYGNTYTVTDTDGNEVTLNDVASASKLSDVAKEAGKHTTVELADGESNLTLNEQNATETAGLKYTVGLSKELSVDKVTAGGANGTVIDVNGLTVAGMTYVSSTGLNAGNKQIHNVEAGIAEKDAVNVSQLKNNIYDKYLERAVINESTGTLDLTVANGNGYEQDKIYNLNLKEYIGELDDYVETAKITKSEDGKDQVVLTRKSGEEVTMDISAITSGLSSSDYHLIGKGADGTGTYSPDEDGNIELQVKDEKTGKVSTVKLEDIASAEDVTDINTTLADGVVKYDYDSETKQYKDSVTLKGENGSQIHNLADGTAPKDAVNLGQLEGKTGDLDYSSNNYVTDKSNLTVAVGDLDKQVYNNTTSITKLNEGWVAQIDGTTVKTVKPNDETNKNNNVLNFQSGDNISLEDANGGIKISATGLAKEDLSNINPTGENKIINLAKDADQHIKPDSYEVGEDGTVTMKYVNGNGEEISGQTATITGVASRDYVNEYITENAGDIVAGANNLTVEKDPTGKENGNWTITDNNGTKATDDDITFTNTTLDTVNSGAVENKKVQSEDGKTTYGQDWVVKDTDGNAVTIEDVASAKTLQSVDTQVKTNTTNIGDLQYNTSEEINNIVNNNDNVTVAIGKLDDQVYNNTTNIANLTGTVEAGWTATDSSNGEVKVDKVHNYTLKFNGDENITVTAENQAINVALNPVVTLDGNKSDGNKIVLDGNNGTINAVNSKTENTGHFLHPEETTTTNEFDFSDGGSFETTQIVDNTISVEGHLKTGTVTTTTDKAEFNEDGATFTNTTNKRIYAAGLPISSDEETSSTNIKGGTITISSSAREDNKDIVINGTAGDVTGLSNTTLTDTDFAKSGRAATEEQLSLAMAQAGENVAKGDTYLHNGTEQIITDKGTVTGYKVNEDGTVTMTVANEDGTKSRDSVVIGNVASKTALDSVTETVNAGWTATAGGNSIAVNPKDGTKLGFAGDENITVTADGTSRQIKVGLNDDITLGDYNDGTGTGVFIGGTSGTISVTNGISVGVDPNNEQKGIVIGGGKSDSIVGLDNIEWKNDADWQKDNIQADRAATEGQLQSAIQQTEAYVNKGWNAAASDGGDPINVKPGDTLNFVGGKNVDVTTENGAVNVALEDDVVLGNEDLYKNYIHLDGNNGTADFNNVVEDENTRTTHNITFDENGATFTREDGIIGDDGIYRGEKTFTTIDGGTVTVSKGSDGMTVINGGNIDTNKVAGLSNTDWNDRIAKEVAADTAGTGAASVAATQGQLKDVADMAGSAAEEAGKHTTVKKGDNNLVITSGVNEAGGSEYTISLNDNILLGDMNTSGVMINGTNGTIAVTNGFTVGSTTVNDGKIIGLANVDWSPEQTRTDEDLYDASQGATQGQLDDLYSSVVGYDINEDGTINYNSITLGNGSATEYKGKDGGGVRLTNVAYAGNITDSAGNVVGSAAVNVDYLNDTIAGAVEEGGTIANSDKHLVANPVEGSNGVYKPQDGKIDLVVDDNNPETAADHIIIDDVASKQELDSVKDNIGDMDFSDTNYIKGDTNLTDAVVDLDGAIKDTNDRIDGLDDKIDGVSNNSIAGGKINEDTGKIDLIKNDGTAIEMEGQLTDSEVTGATFENNTLTINSTDKYDSTKTSSVSVSGIASTDDVTQAKTDITNIIGGNSSTEITNKYEEAGLTDAEGNAPGTLVDADITLNNRIQNVANTSYANDMYLNERINNVENRLGDVEERIDKVGAMAAAIANLRTMGYDPEAPTEIAVGVGQYKSETGLALGIFHYPNQDFMLSASISTSGDEVMGGIGATWKLGRKSAEERAKDEEERILAKAEEIKQAAKRAEVKAQADRHAQLLAEREAAGQPIRPVEEA